MALSLDLQNRLTKLDEKIRDLLSERVTLCQEALEEDEHALSNEMLALLIGEWEAVADEEGWSLPAAQKLARAIFELCRTVGE